ncbi:MAG: 5'-3' exonuclease H3TH domain-containing protein [Candidatus Shapirobacteria bacterium]|nr:5'-3' exonuclease H3TH domain-containing protein [Candidatus Shapirobacteria bacterium]
MLNYLMRRLLIVDGHAIAHRAYHSIPPLTFQGQPVNAIYGFYSMLLTAISSLKPHYLIVCLDSPGPTLRQHEFIGYRAKRKPTDMDLVSQLPLLQESLQTSTIPNFAIGGYEADDLIASLTKLALKKVRKGIISQITIITGDKDLMQLVGPQVELFVPIRGLSETKIFQKDDVKEKLGVFPTQVIDLKALMGDMSDNYPGVAGIGPKVAVDLLSQYKNLDNIYQHLDEIKPAVKEKLINGRENAYLSQKLASLIYDIPFKFKLKEALWNQNRMENLKQLFLNYNFKSLAARLDKKNPPKKINQTSLF